MRCERRTARAAGSAPTSAPGGTAGLRTIAALGDLDLNLEFFGLGESASSDGLGYSVKAKGGVLGGNYRLGRYAALARRALCIGRHGRHARRAAARFAERAARRLRLAPRRIDAVGDVRPARQFLHADARRLCRSVAADVRDSYGSDRDFETANLTAMYFRPLGESLYFSVRSSAKDSSDGTPFYLRPYVSLRGVQALQYQGEQAAELEAEVRWQLRPRYSVVGFAGTGKRAARSARASAARTSPRAARVFVTSSPDAMGCRWASTSPTVRTTRCSTSSSAMPGCARSGARFAIRLGRRSW